MNLNRILSPILTIAPYSTTFLMFFLQILDLHPEHHLQEVWALWLTRITRIAHILWFIMSCFNVIMSSHLQKHLVLWPNKLNTCSVAEFLQTKPVGNMFWRKDRPMMLPGDLKAKLEHFSCDEKCLSKSPLEHCRVGFILKAKLSSCWLLTANT